MVHETGVQCMYESAAFVGDETLPREHATTSQISFVSLLCKKMPDCESCGALLHGLLVQNCSVTHAEYKSITVRATLNDRPRSIITHMTKANSAEPRGDFQISTRADPWSRGLAVAVAGGNIWLHSNFAANRFTCSFTIAQHQYFELPNRSHTRDKIVDQGVSYIKLGFVLRRVILGSKPEWYHQNRRTRLL